MKERLEVATAIVTIIGFPVLLVSMIFVFYQIKELKEVASSQNNIALSVELFDPTNTGIIYDIETDRPILLANKGQYNTAQLDNYLGDFETIDDAYRGGFLSEDQLCVSFSYYISQTASNQEVREYMRQNPDFFGGLSELNTDVAASKDTNCHG